MLFDLYFLRLSISMYKIQSHTAYAHANTRVLSITLITLYISQNSYTHIHARIFEYFLFVDYRIFIIVIRQNVI